MQLDDLLLEMRETDNYGGSCTQLTQLRKYLDAHPDAFRRSADSSAAHWLHDAASGFLYGAVRVFLEYGADPNTRTDDGEVPLASTFNQRDENDASLRTVRTLLKGGADVNASDNEGQSLLYLAWSWSFRQAHDILLAAGARWDLKSAVLCGLVDEVKRILDASKNPSHLVKATRDLGHDAIASARYAKVGVGRPAETLRLLLAQGLDPNGRGPHDLPLMFSAVTGAQNPDVVQALIDCGSEVNAIGLTSGERRTPLDVAVLYGHELSAAVLRAAGAKSAAKLRRGRKRDQT